MANVKRPYISIANTNEPGSRENGRQIEIVKCIIVIIIFITGIRFKFIFENSS